MASRNSQNKQGRKRSLLTFSQITDAFVENGVRSAKDAWALAKARKVTGDDCMWNTLFPMDVTALVGKVLTVWNCETMSNGTLLFEAKFNINQFLPYDEIHPKLGEWVLQSHKTTALVLGGPPGWGKTEFACAIMSALSGPHGFHFVSRIDRIRDVSFNEGQGLVVDEACLRERSIDDCKALVDVGQFGRDIQCRHRDGRLPSSTVRIFSSNWSWAQFWPPEINLELHAEAISRRVLWVQLDKDIRKKFLNAEQHLQVQHPHAEHPEILS